MATAVAAKDKGPKEINFQWEGKDKAGKAVRGDLRATGENVVKATLRRQGVMVTKIKKQKMGGAQARQEPRDPQGRDVSWACARGRLRR